MYGLLGDTADDQFYVKWHKDKEKEDKARGRKKELEAEETARKNIASTEIDKPLRKEIADNASFVLANEAKIRASSDAGFVLERQNEVKSKDTALDRDWKTAHGGVIPKGPTDAGFAEYNQRRSEIRATAYGNYMGKLKDLDVKINEAKTVSGKIDINVKNAKSAMDSADAQRILDATKQIKKELEQFAKENGKK